MVTLYLNKMGKKVLEYKIFLSDSEILIHPNF